MGIPVALFAIPLFGAIIFATFFQRVGLTDTTRKRGWNILSGLGITAGLASLWFIGVQLVVFKSLCPHCVLVHLTGLAVAGLILMRAPLRTQEKLPPPATGHIMVPRRSTAIAMVIALISTIGFAAVHGSLSAAKGPIDRDKILGIPDQKNKSDSGLMMKGLEGITPAQPTENTPNSEAAPANTPATPKEEPTTGGLLLPGLDIAPPKSD